MKRQFHTPAGIEERDLTEAEILQRARNGDMECILTLGIRAWEAAKTDHERLIVLAKIVRAMLEGWI